MRASVPREFWTTFGAKSQERLAVWKVLADEAAMPRGPAVESAVSAEVQKGAGSLQAILDRVRPTLPANLPPPPSMPGCGQGPEGGRVPGRPPETDATCTEAGRGRRSRSEGRADRLGVRLR